jgi:DNA-directed RNA polymerase subunit RPC12/RpoP
LNQKREREMVEMFAVCPRCHVQYLIIYSDGSKLCTYCGFKQMSTLELASLVVPNQIKEEKKQ